MSVTPLFDISRYGGMGGFVVVAVFMGEQGGIFLGEFGAGDL